MTRVLVWLSMLTVPVLATKVSHDQLLEARAEFPEDEDLLYLPSPTQVRRMSLGYREALADLVWVRAVVFAGSRIGRESYGWIAKYLDVISELVPDFRRPYRWGGVIVVYTGSTITKSNIETAIRIYRKGIARFPEDHDMLFALGILLSTEVKEGIGFSAEEVLESKKESTKLIRRAAAFGAPPLVRQLAATLVTGDSTDELAIKFLESQLLTAEDEAHRRMLREKLRSLSSDAQAQKAVRLREDFVKERNAAYPYVDEVLYALIRDESMSVRPEPGKSGESK